MNLERKPKSGGGKSRNKVKSKENKRNNDIVMRGKDDSIWM